MGFIQIIGNFFSPHNDENCDSCEMSNEQEINSLKEESVQIQETIKSLENRLEEVNNRISILQKKNNKGETSNSEVFPIIIPKPLSIQRFEDIRTVLIDHVKPIFKEKRLSDPDWHYYWNLSINVGTDNWLLSKVGKEIVFLRNCDFSSDEIKKMIALIKTCELAVRQQDVNDQIGFDKYNQMIIENYPIPDNPFSEEKPTDFFQDLSSSLYINAYHYLYFMTSYLDVFLEAKRKEPSRKGFVAVPQGIGYNKYYLSCLRMFCDLAMNGMSLAIIPICDENIMYRSQKTAQEGDYISFYYYDNFVEDPQMVEVPKKLEFVELLKEEDAKVVEPTSASTDNPITDSYSYSGGYRGGSWVSSHYRKGHWRNGSYVSGGYVRGHYRR